MSSSVLLAHAQPSICRAVARVLACYGMHSTVVGDGPAVTRVLESRSFGALVLDVALPGRPSFELIEVAKTLWADSGADGSRPGEDERGAQCVVLIASVYRRTSYKRRPARLYGADDYVEVHHLGDLLPEKLCRLLRLPDPPGQVSATVAGEVARTLAVAGRRRLAPHDIEGLAALIVADMVLYNGDRLAGSLDLRAAAGAVAEDLEVARELMAQVIRAEGHEVGLGDPIGHAFASLMTAMGRTAGPA